jgi:dolichyl-phosphooligosaccharide-protein glycotransferase
MQNIFRKNPSAPGYIIALLIAATLGIYFRLYPVTANLERQKRGFSRLTIYANLRKEIANKINTAFPDLEQQQKQDLIDKQFKKTIKSESRKIEEYASGFGKNVDKDIFRFYLLESDPYYYYYLTKKIIESGGLSDKIENGEYLDRLMMAPDGHWRKVEIHPYIGASLYRLLHALDKRASLYVTVAIVPLLLYILSLLAFLALLAALRIDNLSAIISSIFFSLSPILLQRSCFGWYDTDLYNIIFPLTSLWIFFKILRGDNKYMWSIVLALITAVYAVSWQGWFLLPSFIILSFLLISLYRLIFNGTRILLLRQFFTYTLSLFAFLLITMTPKGFLNSLEETYKIISEFILFTTTLWPDIFLTVGELRVPLFNKLIHLLGGHFLFYTSVLGAFAGILKIKRSAKREEGLILVFLYIIAFIMARNAERFSLILLMPVALCFAVGVETVESALKKIFRGVFNIKIACSNAVIYTILCASLVFPIIYGYVSASGQNPIFNTVWERVLIKVRQVTPQNSIINSWWPPGHFIKAVAEREVTFDGATLSTPQAYWMANFFFSDNEKEAIAILKMLNNSGNQATELLLKNNFELDTAVSLIKEIILLDKDKAKNILRSYLPEDKANHLILLTHPTPVPSFCLIYNDLMNGALGLQFAKEWNFKKALDLRTSRYDEFRRGKIFWRGTRGNISLMWDIAGGITYIGEESYQTGSADAFMYFGNGVTIDASRMTATISSLSKHLSGTPEGLLYIENGRLLEKHFANATIRLSILLIPHQDKHYSTIIAPAKILKSILFRLYYLDGVGLRHFEKIIQEEDPRLDTKIMVYKVIW